MGVLVPTVPLHAIMSPPVPSSSRAVVPSKQPILPFSAYDYASTLEAPPQPNLFFIPVPQKDASTISWCPTRVLILVTLATFAFTIHTCSPWIVATSNAVNSFGTVVHSVGGTLSVANRLIGGLGNGIGDIWCRTVGLTGCEPVVLPFVPPIPQAGLNDPTVPPGNGALEALLEELKHLSQIDLGFRASQECVSPLHEMLIAF